MARARGTLRLLFRVTGEQLELLSATPVDMVCPPGPADPPDPRTHGGYWFEVRDAKGDRVFARVVDDPFTWSVEEYSPDGRITRHTGPVEDATFEVLVPDGAGATDVVLLGERRAGETKRRRTKGGAVTELARFSLGEAAR